MTSAVDTSVIVAALLSWHADHDRAARWLGDHLEGRELVLPEPVLIESYSVMTRLPSPHRLSPETAHTLLESNLSAIRVVGIPSSSMWKFLRETATEGTAGGAIYDAVILECAVRAKAGHIATFNTRDFERLARDRIEVIEP